MFTSIFAFECIVKLMALSKDFFGCGWNIFDLIVVSASICDIFLELLEGLSVLRGLRLVNYSSSFLILKCPHTNAELLHTGMYTFSLLFFFVSSFYVRIRRPSVAGA